MAPIRVLLSGGGTGGHLVPGLNLARRLLAGGDVVHVVRTGCSAEAPFLDGLPRLHIHSMPVGGGAVTLPLRLSRRLVAARRLLARERIDIVVGLGGRGSLPCALAAWTRRVPVVLLEQNVEPGRANRLAARFARRVYTAFPDTVRLLPGRPAVFTGMPLRSGLGVPADAELGRRFGLAGETVVVVVGGSQGAHALNLHLPRLLASLDRDLRERIAVIHLAGRGKEAETALAYAGAGIEVHVLPFHADMGRLYSVADLVVCRGGGTSLVEIAAAGKPAAVVPFPWHRDHHQRSNGAWFEAIGAFCLLEQEGLERGAGGEVLEPLLRDAALRRAMGARARAALPRDGGLRVAAELRSLVAGRAPDRERAG